MTPDFQISLDFLRRIYPVGPWMLTAISVDKKAIESRTFEESEHEQVVAWLGLHRQRNLYYSVNEPIESAREKRKLEKSDVRRVHFLHVDVDPRTGEDVQQEQERILKRIQAYSPPPSELVFSGGGYNALWRLSEPYDVANNSPSVEETIRRAIDVERRNWQFELDFETPDHCRDVSRILRLPGTINRPNAEKIKKGRTPALSQVIWSTDASYSLSQFVGTPVVATNQSKGESRVSENVQRVESLDHVRGIPDSLRVIIAQGFDPEDREFNGDRSAILFFVCCELVRCGVPDEIILGVITDSRFQISASVLDKGSGMQRYALRQISRARDKAFHPRLAEMNEQYAVVASYGGRCMIMIQRSSGIEFQRKSEFFDAMDHEKIEFVNRKGKVDHKGVASWWFDQRRRRQFDRVVFEPGADTPGDLNLWRGFAVDPASGSDHLRYIDHLHENICSGNDEHYDYLIRWMARVVQQPRTQSMVAPVLLSTAKGTGKSTACMVFAKLFGQHSAVVDNPDKLTGQFNAHLANCVVVVAEEAFDLRDRKHDSILKEMITGAWRGVERKGVDIYRDPNYIHLMMTSNNERVIPAGDHERRYLVLNVGDGRIQDSKYFLAMNRDFCVTENLGSPLRPSGGAAHLLHHLMGISLADFDVTKVPQTRALREQQEHALSAENEWLLQKLESGVWMSGRERWEGPVVKEDLYQNYVGYAKLINLHRIQPYRTWHQWIVRTLSSEEHRVTDRQIMTSSHARPSVFDFPRLDECRAAYLHRRGWQTYDWPAVLRSVDETKSQGAFE